MISAEHLRAVAGWARDLPDADIEFARRGISEKTFGKGVYICHRGDRFDYWTGVVSGLVRLGSVSRSGKEVTFAGLPPGGWFGEGSLIKGEARRYDLLTLRETRLAMMNRATFLGLFENSVAFNRYLVRQFNERLGQFIALVEHDRMHSTAGKLARNLAWLLNPVLNPTVGLKVDITQEELGLLSGLSRQMANQGLRTLEQAGLIRLEHGGLTVLDLDRLRGYGDGDNGDR